MTVKVYVEGGGDHNKALATRCRQGFSEFFRKAGFEGRMPGVVVSGGRHRAYDRFRTAHENAGVDEVAVLLVDSEAPVDYPPWEHVRLREGDGWQRPPGASDDQLQFMVQTMEAWFHADKEVLQRYYGQCFRPAALSQRQNIEDIPKRDLFAGLQGATRNCDGEYSKGEHSFKILARIDPVRVRALSPHCGRLLSVLDGIC